ncbi:hypothetical protein DSM106972_065890 [Dulcicalothrix desertica PCC 7102]|uniref:Serine protease n=1 Tax=Dulcicalothrix desertica PCC 7102 TaxID=232991 RepID=A0A3S1AYQ4_9CYAN|nr:S1C family serine protease [Dulcicalothrix desertica]RUT01492.1 hypothetical protein DSM106972_065890 [Dulcicalothrix desertica PCC 7102]TWH43471.1 Trypsin-like serine proteases, typically periplasmic, containing C-terminal PDZ domain [Dulcicalothrix desertica PCC 7102]
MQRHTNKSNKKLFVLFASSLLAVNLLTACSSKKTSAINNRDDGVAIAETLSKPTNQSNNPARPSSTVASQKSVSVGDLAKPAVVQLASACAAQIPFSYKGSTKIYEVSAGGTGSGFFVSSDGYIVTNAHVIQASINPQKCQQALYEQYIQEVAQDVGVNPDELSSNPQAVQEIRNNFQNADIRPINNVLLPNGNYLPFDIQTSGAPVGQGKDVAVVKVQIKNAPVLKLADSEQVKTQDKIIAIGYPSLQLGALNSKSETEATISSGEISSTEKQLSDGSPVLQFNAAVTHGNSGGPVLNEKGEVVGITTFGSKNISGIGFAVTSNTIMEFVRQLAISNEQGAVDKLYNEGLQLYNQGQYAQAIEKLETVKRLFPQHSEVDKLIQESQEKIVAAK